MLPVLIFLRHGVSSISIRRLIKAINDTILVVILHSSSFFAVLQQVIIATHSIMIAVMLITGYLSLSRAFKPTRHVEL